MKIELKKEAKIHIVLLGILLVILLFSVITYSIKLKGNRRTFIFPSVENGKLIVETRYLQKNPQKDSITFFIDELLLGSGVERTKLLFTSGTRLESAFLRKDILYLNLSDDLMQMGDGVLDIEEGVELLKKNVRINFPKVKTIQIFVNGRFAFE
ncbi:MAG: GerMN domain-containing protein [Treponema sp.]|nr:GerMN domain-containing protein [Treponema sp.]